jgi:hypothetical protein
MGLNPTGSEIPRSLTNVATTIDQALDLKVDLAAYQNAGGIDAGIWKEQLDLTGVNTGDQDLSGLQATLVSGTNIKTINGASVLGPGDVAIAAASTAVLAPVELFRSRLSSYIQPEVGSATLAFSRNFGVSQLLSTGLYSDAAHQTAAYNWDARLSRNRYKSTNEITSIVAFGDNRALNTAGWAIVDGTRAVNQTGIDGTANSCTLFTASSANATLLYAVTLASSNRTLSAFIRRVTGSGRVFMTRNGGTHWIDVTAQLNTNGFTRVFINSDVTNPSVGFRLETSGDAIAIDAVSDTPGAIIYDAFVSRSDQRKATLTFGSMLPSCTNGRRYELSAQVRVKNADVNFVARNTADTSFVRMQLLSGGGFNLASFSGGVSQYNLSPSVIRPVAIGEDVKFSLLWGQGKIQAMINDTLIASLDTPGRLDPVDVNTIPITGEADFSDLVLRELRSKHICLVGDSITAATTYPALFYNGLDQRDYAISARGVSGNGITDVTSRVATDITPTFNARFTSNTVLLWIGTNSLAANVSAATALTQLASLITAIKAGASWTRVVCVSTLRRGTTGSGGFSNGATGASFETQRLLYNAGQLAAGADAFIDLDGVTEAQNTSVTHFFDSFQIHPLPALYQLFWPIIKTAVA